MQLLIQIYFTVQIFCYFCLNNHIANHAFPLHVPFSTAFSIYTKELLLAWLVVGEIYNHQNIDHI